MARARWLATLVLAGAAGAAAAVAGERVLARRLRSRPDPEAGEDLEELPPEDLGPLTAFDGTELAVRAGVKRLLYAHHHPDRTDEPVERDPAQGGRQPHGPADLVLDPRHTAFVGAHVRPRNVFDEVADGTGEGADQLLFFHGGNFRIAEDD